MDVNFRIDIYNNKFKDKYHLLSAPSLISDNGSVYFGEGTSSHNSKCKYIYMYKAAVTHACVYHINMYILFKLNSYSNCSITALSVRWLHPKKLSLSTSNIDIFPTAGLSLSYLKSISLCKQTLALSQSWNLNEREFACTFVLLTMDDSGAIEE